MAYEGQLEQRGERSRGDAKMRVTPRAITDLGFDPTPNRVHGKRPCLNRGIKNSWRPRRAYGGFHIVGGRRRIVYLKVLAFSPKCRRKHDRGEWNLVKMLDDRFSRSDQINTNRHTICFVFFSNDRHNHHKMLGLGRIYRIRKIRSTPLPSSCRYVHYSYI
jgi:hypothetical protein